MSETDGRSAQLVEIARLAVARGDAAAAIASFRQAVALDEASSAGSRPEILVALGTLEAEAGELGAAAGHLRGALERQTAELGEDSPALADTMMRLAAVSAALDDLEAAEALLRRATNVVDPDGPALPALLNDLARVLVRRGDNPGAESVLVRLHGIKAARIGAAHPEVATVVAALAAVRQALGKHESAEQLWREVVEVRERTLAPGHFATSIAIEGLAGACATRGNFAEAVLLLRRAMAMREQTLGAGHASLAQLRARVADLELQAAYADPATEGGAPPLSGTHGLVLSLPASSAGGNGVSHAGAQQPPRPILGPGMRIVATRVAAVEHASAVSEPSEETIADALRSLRVEMGEGDGGMGPRRESAAPLLLVPEDDEHAEEWSERPAGLVALLARRRVPIVAGAVALLAVIAAVSLARQRGDGSEEWVVTAETAPSTVSLASAGEATEPEALAHESTASGSLATADDSAREATTPSGGRPRTSDRAASDRTASDRTASDRVASDRTASDRVASDRVASQDRAETRQPPAVQAPAVPTVDLSGVTTAIGRGAVDSAALAGARPGVAENARALLTRAAPLRTGMTGGDVGFRAALLDAKGPQPLYPNALKGTRRRGTATLAFTVDSSGRAYGIARVTKADHPAFAQSVIDALPRMRFIPATENGVPVRQQVVMTFTFVPLDD